MTSDGVQQEDSGQTFGGIKVALFVANDVVKVTDVIFMMISDDAHLMSKNSTRRRHSPVISLKHSGLVTPIDKNATAAFYHVLDP